MAKAETGASFTEQIDSVLRGAAKVGGVALVGAGVVLALA